MRVVLMFILGVALIAAAAYPRKVLMHLDRIADGVSTRLDHMVRVNEQSPGERRAERRYEAWLKDPAYDVATLERLWRATGKYAVLLHLVEATMQGCGRAYESTVLESEAKRLQPADFVMYRKKVVLKNARCAANSTRAPLQR